MRILFDIGHPAHVHNYRNLGRKLEGLGHLVFWTVKDLPVAKQLLDYYGFKYKVFPKKSDLIFGKIWKQLIYDVMMLFYCRQKNIDLVLGTSVTIAHVSRISRVSSIVFDDDDDEVQPLITKYVHPFADALLSPDCLSYKRKRADTIYYSGYHELAYLHPNYFKPDPWILSYAGLTNGEPFFIMRFNAFKAHHDSGALGLNLAQKMKLIEVLTPHGKVLITTEREIEPELREYQLKISPEKVHSLMYYATMFLGDSQTMTSEAAVIGTPAVKCNSFAGRLSVPNELENKYHLCYSYVPQQFDLMLAKVYELINNPNLRMEWNTRKQKMLKEKIDVTTFWSWFIDSYPGSTKILKQNPNYQERFK